MTSTKTTSSAARGDAKKHVRQAKLAYVKHHRFLYFMLLLPIAYYIIFHYIPMGGIVIAFKNYSIFQGIFPSPWVGLDNFTRIFTIPEFSRAIRNTLVLNLLNLLVGFPAPIIPPLILFRASRRHCTFFLALYVINIRRG